MTLSLTSRRVAQPESDPKQGRKATNTASGVAFHVSVHLSPLRLSVLRINYRAWMYKLNRSLHVISMALAHSIHRSVMSFILFWFTGPRGNRTVMYLPHGTVLEVIQHPASHDSDICIIWRHISITAVFRPESSRSRS